MDCDDLTRTGTTLLAQNVSREGEAADLVERELERFSAEYYDQRRKIWTKINRGDWWISIAVYLAAAAIVYVIL